MSQIDMLKIMQRVRDGLERGVLEGAEAVRSTSVKLTPIRTGDLRKDAMVSPVVWNDMLATVAVGYSMIYAARQHEETGWQHPRGGQAKFLESAVNQEKSFVETTLAKHIQGAFR